MCFFSQCPQHQITHFLLLDESEEIILGLVFVLTVMLEEIILFFIHSFGLSTKSIHGSHIKDKIYADGYVTDTYVLY